MLEIINVVECNTRVCMHGLLSGQFLPPPHGLVAIDRIEFNQVCLPLRPLACDEGSAAPAKAVDNEIATARTVPSATSATGFMVGCMPSSSSRSVPNAFDPA